MRSSESLVNNRFYIVYDYNHYNIVYDNQCSIYSGTKLSITNFECLPFELFYHFRGISLLYVCLHVCSLRHVHLGLYEYKLKCSVPRIITVRYA